MLLPELRDIAQKLQVKNYETLGKQELIGNILLKQKESDAVASSIEEGEDGTSPEKKKRGRKRKLIVTEDNETEEDPIPVYTTEEKLIPVDIEEEKEDDIQETENKPERK